MLKRLHGGALVAFAFAFGCGPKASTDLLSASAWKSRPSDAALAQLALINPVWRERGHNAAGSMPMGNGELGANVWVEDNGDLVLLISHTDSFSEAERLLKLGRVRIVCEPPLSMDASFTQTLLLARGALQIQAGDARIELIIDAASPSIFIRMESDSARTMTATLEPWRTTERSFTGDELKSSWLMHDAPATIEVKESADVLVVDPDAVVWYHRNEFSYAPMSLEHQGLASVASAVEDPLILRTFGGRIEGEGFARVDRVTMKSTAPATEATLHITASCSQADDLDGWLERLQERAASVPDFTEVSARTAAWWSARWTNSFVFIESAPAKSILENAHPLRIGYDSNGQNQFAGEIKEVRFVTADTSVVVASENGAKLELAPELEASVDFTIDAWVKPASANLTGRIADKLTAGGSDGFLFDLQNGKLRAIVGDALLQSQASLSTERISHVALVFQSGVLQLYVDDVLVGESAQAALATQGATTLEEAYALQRFVTLAATRGAFPVKFNGSIFTIAPAPINGKPFNDDWRAWGGAFWWQNTRLPYHGMLARGDGDSMQSLFAFYSRLLPIAKARARIYYGASGAYFPETMTTFGGYSNEDYGWNREGKAVGDVDCAWWRWAWNQGPELVALMLDHWDYTHDRAQLDAQTIPMASAVLEYFATRFSLDANGVLVITPTQSLETYWTGVVNDLPAIAGIREITSRLCALPSDAGSSADRALWERMRAACPALPTVKNAATGVETFAAAEKFDPQRSNCENPELSAVWPFNFSGVGRGDLAMGRASYAARIERFVNGWPQDGQQAARLGLADEAASIVLAKSRNTNKAFRFPTFWGPNFDWVPDQCHGGNLLTTMQEMLLQSVGDKIIVCPALPKSWSGKFRLHAAHNTTVTASLKDGAVEWMTVDPSSRAKDVEFGEGWSLR